MLKRVSFPFLPISAFDNPHVWETPSLSKLGIRIRKFIPTCVGNSSTPEPRTTPSSVHPHMRGELKFSPLAKLLVSDSSPRAWRTPVDLPPEVFPVRFIPTCVGNSPLSSDDVMVHVGSSPHAWETRSRPLRRSPPRRFIPTCVGNSAQVLFCEVRSPVHPHMRGELMTPSCSRLTSAGSSPHAWGTRTISSSRSRVLRFIPTCVGNSRLC